MRFARRLIAPQIVLTLCTLGSPAWSQQQPPPLPPPAAPPAAPAAAPPAAPSVQVVQGPPMAADGVQVRIFDINKLDAPRPMALVGPAGGTPVCEAPSAAPCVAPPGRYRVMGRGMRDTDEFDLRGSGPLDIGVDRGSKAAFYTGIGVASAGGVSGLTGGLFLLAAPSAGRISSSSMYVSTVDQEEIYRVYGWTFIVLGTAALITGIVLITRNSSSTATVTRLGGASGGGG